MADEHAAKGIPWSLLTFGCSRALNLLTTIVVARLLTPRDFGVVALATLVIGVLGVVKDLGLVNTLVARQDLDSNAISTIQTLMLATGAVVAAGVALTAPLSASVFDEPQLESVQLALSLTLLLGSVGWFYEGLLQRALRFRARFLAHLTQSVVYGGVAVLMAIAGAGLWSLVVGQITGLFAFTTAVILMATRRFRAGFDRSAAREVWTTGRGYALQSGVAFVEQNVDYIVVGRLAGPTQLGLYSMAYRLSEMPYLGIADPVAKVTFPRFARIHLRGASVQRQYLEAVQLVALVALPLGIGLSATAEPLTAALLGSRWLGMVGILGILGLWGAIKSVQATAGWLLNSVGHGNLLGVVSSFLLALQVPALILAGMATGVTGVAWVMLAHISLTFAIYVRLASSHAGVSVRLHCAAVLPVAIAAMAAWAAARGVVEVTSGWTPAAALVVALLSGVAIYVMVLTIGFPSVLRNFVARLRESVPRRVEHAS